VLVARHLTEIGDVSSREQAEAATGDLRRRGQPEAWRAVGRRLMTSAEFLWEPLNEAIEGFVAHQVAAHLTRERLLIVQETPLCRRAAALFHSRACG
jgi:hypothetical protein